MIIEAYKFLVDWKQDTRNVVYIVRYPRGNNTGQVALVNTENKKTKLTDTAMQIVAGKNG